eukprot:UC1_evm1s1403
METRELLCALTAIVDEMHKAGVKPNTATVVMYCETMCLASDPAIEWQEISRELRLDAHTFSGDPEENFMAVNALIKLCSVTANVQKAAQLYKN